jgi:DNA-binding NarL/FixJ family response regulator
MNIRILVADDFAPWRRFVSSAILPKKPGWHIVCEVSDGVEAVKRAEELRPDLILLDIGLPKLNGIEAARQISKIAPNLKILFLSAFDSLEVVEEALNTGANGYVVKLDAASELVGAVEAVFQGKRYVSRRLKGVISAQAEDVHASDKPVHDEVLASRLIRSPETEFTRCHEVLFYSDDVSFLESITHFIGTALRFGNAAVVLATKPHRDMLLEELKAQGVDADVLLQQGSYVSLDAADTLSKFMISGLPDPDRFFETFKTLIESASKAAKAKHPRVAIFGEGVALLWAEGKRDAAIRLEQLGNDLAGTRKVDILCAYPSRLQIQEDKHSFGAVCAVHSAVHSK